MVAKHEGTSYAEFVSTLYDCRGLKKGKPFVGDKTPTYVHHLPTLTALWPHTRIVHLIRDGRDVWLSMRQWRMAHKAAGSFATWGTDPVVTTALWWKALVGIGCQDGAAMDSQHYQSISYEALVTDCESECRSLAEFLAIQYDPKMPRYYEGHTRREKKDRPITSGCHQRRGSETGARRWIAMNLSVSKRPPASSCSI